MMNVIINQCGQQIVSNTNGMQITVKVEVNVLHGDDLCMAATGCAPLHAKNWTQRRLAETNDRVLPNLLERIA